MILKIVTLCMLLAMPGLNLRAQADTCFISDSAQSYLDKDDNWFSLNVDLVQIDGTVDTMFYRYTDEIKITGPENCRWLYQYLVTRKAEGVIVVLDSAARKRMSYRITGEGRIGDYYEYYSDGKIKVKGYYCEECPGVKSGAWYYYNESGEVIKQKRIKRKHCNGKTPTCV